jgi:hypothetical protein
MGLGKWWRGRKRDTDLKVLWPQILKEASDLDAARTAFGLHAINDTAWTTDYTLAAITGFVDNLEESLDV